MNNNKEYINFLEKELKETVKEIFLEFEEQKEQKEKNHNKAYENTKILMKNYNFLKNNILKIDENEDGLFLKSITKSNFKTLKVLKYIENIISIIKFEFEKNGELYKFESFEKYYLDQKTIEEISFELNCGKNSVRRWNENVLDRLSVLLWGIDYLEI